MNRFFALICLVAIAGCASVDPGDYRPKSKKENVALKRSDRSVAPEAVRSDFEAYRSAEVAWAGVIESIQYNETERSIQVAFEIEHRHFDWVDYGGGRPYHLSPKGDGWFTAGWVVSKPARVSYLKTLAAPGDMIIVYGTPYQMKDGVVQLSATALRLVDGGDFEVVSLPGEDQVGSIESSDPEE